jgi:CheY-like chemotaxis protein
VTETILVVHGEPASRAALAAMLGDSGYQVLTAGTVPAAMQVLEESRPAVLVTGARLGAYNGLHLAAMAPEFLPSVLITDTLEPGLDTDARQLGAVCLRTPVTPDALRSLVGRMLAGLSDAGGGSPVRRWPRRSVTGRHSVVADDLPARLLDVSEGGARLSIRWPAGRPVPDSVRLQIPELQASLVGGVAWARQTDDETLECGIALHNGSGSEWRTLLEFIE